MASSSSVVSFRNQVFTQLRHKCQHEKTLFEDNEFNKETALGAAEADVACTTDSKTDVDEEKTEYDGHKDSETIPAPPSRRLKTDSFGLAPLFQNVDQIFIGDILCRTMAENVLCSTI